jgi:arginase
MPKFTTIDAPSILGLRPSGVEKLPEALKRAGLATRLHADDGGRVRPLPYSAERDPATMMLNPVAIHAYSRRLADVVERQVREKDRPPLVLGGDCSILIGNLLALRRLGRYGLFFIDGHADFYQPEASPTGEVADMDLAIVSGRGPEILTNIDGLKPLVRDEDIVLFGYRDAEEAAKEGSQDVRDSGIHVYDLATVQGQGVTVAASAALQNLLKDELAGFWIHLDADVLDDAIMPAVDYRQPGGLQFDELSALLKTLFASGQVVGMDITIFNPSLDPDDSIARAFVDSIVDGLT